jgi:hypothetical protein
LVEGSPYVRFYAPIVDDLEESPELLRRLNELNCVHGHLHFCLLNNSVTCVSDVLVSPFQIGYVGVGLSNFLQIAEELGNELLVEFGSGSNSQEQFCFSIH